MQPSATRITSKRSARRSCAASASSRRRTTWRRLRAGMMTLSIRGAQFQRRDHIWPYHHGVGGATSSGAVHTPPRATVRPTNTLFGTPLGCGRIHQFTPIGRADWKVRRIPSQLKPIRGGCACLARRQPCTRTKATGSLQLERIGGGTTPSKSACCSSNSPISAGRLEGADRYLLPPCTARFADKILYAR